MKRISALILCFVFFFTGIGVRISVHFCGDHAEDISFFENGTCGCDTEDTSSGCCKDEVKRIQIKDHYLNSTLQLKKFQFSFIQLMQKPELFADDVQSRISDPIFYDSDFHEYRHDKSILYCCSRI